MDHEGALRQMTAVCGAACAAFGAVAVSVATVEPEGLRYVAASGVGADAIVGTVLPIERGLAGYVALSGRSMAVDRPADDPRFAADVARRTGVIPSSMLLVPVHDEVGDVIAVLSVLDRAPGATDALQTGVAFAELLASILPGATAALAADGSADGDAAGSAAAETLRRLRSLDPEVGRRALGLIDDLLDVLTSKQRR